MWNRGLTFLFLTPLALSASIGSPSNLGGLQLSSIFDSGNFGNNGGSSSSGSFNSGNSGSSSFGSAGISLNNLPSKPSNSIMDDLLKGSSSSGYTAAEAWDTRRNKPDGIDRGFDPNYQQTDGRGSTVATAPNCREFILTTATSQAACANVRQSDIMAGTVSATNGFCRWDADGRSCMCPRPRTRCDDLPQCFWFRDQTLSPSALRAQPNAGECISNAERFYNILSGLLTKRGKKDFAIRINYSSAPARGNLPSGPYGPAVIGGGNMQGIAGMPGFGVPMNPGLLTGSFGNQPFNQMPGMMSFGQQFPQFG